MKLETMEELEPNVTRMLPVIENANNVHLHINGIEKESQGLELDEPIRNVLEEGHVTKQVHRFYFAKVMPSKLEAKIEEMEELIEKQDLFQICSELKERMNERDVVVLSRLNRLYDKERGLRERLAQERKYLDHLQQILDKLCFANNAYQGRAIKSQEELDTHLAIDKLGERAHDSCSSLQELDKHKLHFRMQHGRNNLAEEKKLIKEIKASQQKAISSCLSLDELNRAICRYYYHPMWYYWPFNKKVEDEERIIRERKGKQFICLREKAIATAVVKGKLWNSFGSKQAIHDEVKLRVTELDGIRKELFQLRANIKQVEKELHPIKKDVKSLEKQKTVRQDRKDVAYNRILQMRKLHDQESSCYYQYHSTLKNASKLAQKKDLAALNELSRGQVDRFMSQWNSSRAFRDEYETMKTYRKLK